MAARPGPLARLPRLLRTVRWLKPTQVLGRLRFRLQRFEPDARAAPPRRQAGGAWVSPAAREPSLVSATGMHFLDEEQRLEEVGWDDPALPLLWRYNQHYFDDLNATDATRRHAWHVALVGRWLKDNPAGRGTAYAPYPVSLRVVNWVKWFAGGVEPEQPWLDSLALQARWLRRRLEWHLLGNHLFANAKALVYAGLFFEGAEAEAWLATGLAIVQRELPEQILADGGHFERSPMYHALALEDVLDLLNAIAAWAPPGHPAAAFAHALRQRASAMLCWLRCLRHPDGTLARFNDCAEGLAPPHAEIERYAAALGIAADDPPTGDALVRLEPSGYVRVQRGPATALLDVAPIGPDYLPGHAHADTLSFELSLGRRRLIVNRGTSVYGDGLRRQLERGTAAHSTVQLGTQDSSEVWAGFRVGRRARPGPLYIDDWSIEGSHDGYTHLRGRPRHHRRWHFDAQALAVSDRIEPVPHEAALARFHLAPGLNLVAEATADGSRWQVHDNGALLAEIEVEGGGAFVEHWDHAERFGRLVPATTLAVPLRAGRSTVHWRWTS